MVTKVVKDEQTALTLEPLVKQFAQQMPGVDKSTGMLHHIVNSLHEPTYLLVVEFEDTESVGYITAQALDNYGELMVFVEQFFASRAGVGTELFNLVCAWAKSNNIGIVQGVVLDRGEAMARLVGADVVGHILKKEV